MERKDGGDGPLTIGRGTAAGDQDGVGPGAPVEEGSLDSTYRPKHVPYWENLITIVGGIVAALAVMLLATFALLTIVSPKANPYVDIVGYLILPGLLGLGLAAMPVGILFKSWRLRRKDPSTRLAFRFPRIDLNDFHQRRAAKFVVGGTFIFLPVVGVSSYHGYHYTDSSDFCAKACHSVMEPEATTYERSPHARVACAECHIGTGASWFVKSKLSGTRQVLAMWQKSYSRPIAPAIQHLRPARETCEHCHWPKKFYGAQLKEIVHFKPDEANTRRPVTMLLNIGGGASITGHEGGIHWHMALANQIEYIATDDRLQVIPWMRKRDLLGQETIYRSDGRPSSDPPPEGQLRELDCMDCHNRPAHEFLSPREAVDVMLDANRIDRTLPYIKREAMLVLAREYPDVETAEREIGTAIAEFYQKAYPEVWQSRRASVNQAIDVVREIYRSNFFPYMRVDWRTYPDNIGHMTFSGCFRCHDEQHVNQAGEALHMDCDSCHSFLNQEVREDGSTQFVGGEFVHPMDLVGVHKALRCDQCHDGGLTPPSTCKGCHTLQAAFRAGTLDALAAFDIGAEPMADIVECEECHDLDEPTTVEAIDVMCMGCHDEEPPYVGMVAAWKKEAEGLLSEATKHADERGREILRLLQEVGPLHHMEATRAITGAVSTGRIEAGQTSSDVEVGRP